MTSVKHDDVDDPALHDATSRRRSGALLALCRGARRRAGRTSGPPGDARGRLPRPDRSSAARLRRSPMRALRALTIANVRELHPRPGGRSSGRLPSRSSSSSCSGSSSRAAAGPVSTSAGSTRMDRPRPRQLRAGFAAPTGSTLTDQVRGRRHRRCRTARSTGDRRPGRLWRGSRGRRRRDRRARPSSRSTPTHRVQQLQVRSTRSSGACSASSTSAAGRRWSCPSPQTVQTENLNSISYFVPSILGAVGHAGRHLRGDPAGRRPREADPQAAVGDPACGAGSSSARTS